MGSRSASGARNWGNRAVKRRTILKLAAAGVLPATSGLVQLATADEVYSPEFFTGPEFELLDQLSEVILPADEHSPGAQAAKVARYIDVVVADGNRATQDVWRSGLRAVDGATRRRFKRNFVQCDAGQQDEVVAQMSRKEEDPEGDADRFFVLVKRATIDGYYTSRVGIHEDLGYQGNTAVDEFPGCTHEEHA